MKRAMFSACFGLIWIAGAAQGAPIFEFHSGFWVNLHHFLYEQAAAATPPASAPPAWRKAVDYYHSQVVLRDLLSDEAAHINDRLSDLESAASLHDSGLPPGLVDALESAAPIYKAQWWPKHDAANHAWIEAVTPQVAMYGASLKKELAAAYQTDWPATPVRVDVAEYANWSGAYTTIFPTHVTVSSVNPGNQGDAALEVLFHESSHALILKIRDALGQEMAAEHKLFRTRNFWHAVLFYTTGEIVRRHLDNYAPYVFKNGLYMKAWTGAPEVLDKDWKPYLDGEIDLPTAVRRLVADYGVPHPMQRQKDQ
jgi:hypothetical protein